MTIYHARCQDVLLSLPAIGSVVTDPPYGIGVNKMTLGNGAKKISRGSSDWDNATPTQEDFDTLRAISQHQIFWGGNYFADKLPVARGWLVWDKCTGANDYADCELAWTNIDIVVKKFTKFWVGNNAKDTLRRVHPTQKPVDLMRWCIGLIAAPGVIFDPFMGGGSVLRAAMDLGIPAIGCDTEEIYCEAAAQRMSQMPMLF